MKVYGLKTCDTVRAAMRALTEAGHTPELVDIRADGIEEADLQRFSAAFGEALVNRRSTTWRGLSEAERADDPVRQILAHPALMKRPVIEDGAELTLGWDKSVQTQWLGNPA
jgi:arsenate reductase-like glutaredoxin family protein